MKEYQTKEIRNVSLLGNSGSGKTTIAEAILYAGGVISRRGDVATKNTVSDFKEIEHEQQGSVFSSVLYTEHRNKKINILDCPGSDDFVGSVISSLKVTDTALLVLNSQNGVEVGAEISWRNAEKKKKPVVLVINQLDHEKSNYEKTLEEARLAFGNKVTVVQYPINAGPGLNAIIDVITMKMYKFGPDGGVPEILDIPADEKDTAADYQNTLIEAAAENDDTLMELFFENGTLTEDEMRKGLKIGLIKRDVFPVFCTAAKKDIGVRRLFEFIVNVAPCPADVPPPKDTEGKEIICNENGKTSVFVFKSSMEQHLGEITYFKVMSGSITEGMDLININKQSKERISQIYAVAGKNRQKVSKLVAGDIGATVKLKETKNFHTLNDKGADWKFPRIEFPAPKYRTALKCVNEADEEKLGEALGRMSQEDPTIIIEYAKELKQLIVHGQGEFHLNILKWHLDNIYKISTTFLTPKIPYRETITKPAQAMYRHKKQSGGAGQFGEVHLVIEPYEDGKPDPTQFKLNGQTVNVSVRGKEEFDMPWGGKLVFCNCIVGGVIEARFMPAILKGIMKKMENGPLTGCYARDIRVSVYDGKMHPVDSNEISFQLAGQYAFSEAFKNAGPKIMEPIYDVEVWVPSDKMGDVMSDLQGRRAMIEGMTSEKGFEKLKVRVPLAEMNKYSTTLSSLTNGRAMYAMSFAEYQQVPTDIQEKLLKEYVAEKDDE